MLYEVITSQGVEGRASGGRQPRHRLPAFRDPGGPGQGDDQRGERVPGRNRVRTRPEWGEPAESGPVSSYNFV